MTVKILVDAIHLLAPKTGIGKYTYENCLRLQAIAGDEVRWDYYYGYVSRRLAGAGETADNTADKDAERDGFYRIHGLKSVVMHYGFVKSTVMSLLNFVQRFSGRRYDLYWQPNVIPNQAIRAGRVVTTVQDVSFLVNPDWHPVHRRKYMGKMIFAGIRRSDKVIAGSYFTKGEILKYTGCDPAKITVIYSGIDHQVFKVYPNEEMLDFRQRHNLPEQYLFFVGSIEPRKNLIRLLSAYRQYVDLSNEEALPLILVGFKGWQNSEIMQAINACNGKVRYLGYLTDRELAYTYNLATVFLYPSLYEGFGIPPLEAMACGTPVITSRVTAIPEVCGEAALYVDPEDEGDIRDKIKLLASQEDLRREFVKRGLERCRNFTWEDAAEKHWELFKEMLGF